MVLENRGCWSIFPSLKGTAGHYCHALRSSAFAEFKARAALCRKVRSGLSTTRSPRLKRFSVGPARLGEVPVGSLRQPTETKRLLGLIRCGGFVLGFFLGFGNGSIGGSRFGCGHYINRVWLTQSFHFNRAVASSVGPHSFMPEHQARILDSHQLTIVESFTRIDHVNHFDGSRLNNGGVSSRRARDAYYLNFIQ